MPCAYVIENSINGKLYVGFTGGDFVARWKRHILAAAHGNTFGKGVRMSEESKRKKSIAMTAYWKSDRAQARLETVCN